MPGYCNASVPFEALAVVAMFEFEMPETAFFRRSESVVKFWTTCRLPPKFITDITWSGPACASMNFPAAARARG